MKSIGVLLLLVVCSTAMSGDLSPEKLRDVEEFGYQGINFSTSRREFLASYPRALKQDEEDSLGLVKYWITIQDAATGRLDVVGLTFLGDKLMNMTLLFQKDKIARLGGVEVLIARAIDRFGTPSARIGADFMAWEFPDIDRVVLTATGDNGSWVLGIRRQSLARRHEKLKLGF